MSEQCTKRQTLIDFRAALCRLRLDDDGISPSNDSYRIGKVAQLAAEVITATTDPAEPQDLLARRLALLAQRLIRLHLHRARGPRAVRDFMLARAELIELDALAGR